MTELGGITMCVHPGAELGFHTSNTMQLFDISVALWEMMLFSSFPSFFFEDLGQGGGFFQ